MSEESKVKKHLGEAKSSKAKEKKLHTHRLTIERAHHGGHILHHEMRDEDGNPGGTQTSVAADNDDMGNQVQDAMGDQPPAGEGAPPTSQPDPSDGAPSPAQGM